MDSHRLVAARGLGACFLVAAFALGPAAGGATAQERPRCTAVNVVGMSVQAARAALRAGGCLPGNARDGRHFVVNSGCFAVPFGLIAQQSKVGRLGKRELLVLTKSVENLGGNSCATITPDPTVNDLSDLDGTYAFGYQVTASNDPAVPVGAAVDGLELTVANGRLGGIAQGVITWSPEGNGGTARNATGDFRGSTCRGDLTFTIGADGLVRLDGRGISCDGGDIIVKIVGAKRA